MSNDIPDLAGALAELARTASDKPELEDTLRVVTTTAVELIRGAETADVLTISRRREFRSHAPTSDLPIRLDSVQEELGEGPCVDAAFGERIIHSDDLTTDQRWPRFRPSAREAGVRSSLSFQLYTGSGALGALNLFSSTAHAFSPADVEVGLMLATHAAVALHGIRKSEHFESALASRDVIGQAKGMIMERFAVDAVRAFELMRKLSQDSNVPVVKIAEQVVERGSSSVDH
ncbi:GAF domain-containing protein [Williamsia limnetica]|uniref:GAF domain-containing protein n=1 Tax=Williamsia limnetica TaxID=882452 RepID=A0A318RQ00_WILLI|nr:GAF and ANTAR domain-containing protein [Williamsia limnetica]PYE17366.1 GAF domain-containing protein [Williamsia limnetica]